MARITRRIGTYLLLGAAIAAVAAVAIVFHPIDVTYRLWRYRSDPDSVEVYQPSLCAKGSDVVEHVVAALDEHGDRTDVAGFRVSIANTLRCIRREQGAVTNEDNAYRDLPPDPRLFGAIVRAFTQEPDPELRDDMLTFMWELDFRAHFAIWAGIVDGPRSIPDLWSGLPEIDPYGHSGSGRPLHPARRAEWCKVVAPRARRMVAEDRLGNHEVHALHQLGKAACTPGDVQLVREHAIGGGQ